MKRRSKTRTVAIHMTIPVRLLEDFDETLTYKQSRSKIISKLIQNYLARENSNLQMMTSIEVFEFMQYRFKKDSPEDILIQSLLQILAKSD